MIMQGLPLRVRKAHLRQPEMVVHHVLMAARHVCRACLLMATTAVRFLRGRNAAGSDDRMRDGRRASVTLDAKLGEKFGSKNPTPVDETATPDPDTLFRRGLIFPIGTWKEKWDLLILMCIFFSAITVPVRMCFSVAPVPYSNMWYLEVTIAFAFVLDVCMNFNTVRAREL